MCIVVGLATVLVTIIVVLVSVVVIDVVMDHFYEGGPLYTRYKENEAGEYFISAVDPEEYPVSTIEVEEVDTYTKDWWKN